ncbi:MAG: hypothetical protein DMG37_03735 [Acidobacteria bacterium]|nr:MAG: hypothetical protein DMG37_03735 [Acidobacteriota bacterium]
MAVEFGEGRPAPAPSGKCVPAPAQERTHAARRDAPLPGVEFSRLASVISPHALLLRGLPLSPLTSWLLYSY